MIFESDIEARLVNGVEKLGGLCPKFGMDGWPDRIVILPGGRLCFVELKRPDGEASKLQQWRAVLLRRLGQVVHFPRCVEDVDELLREWSE